MKLFKNMRELIAYTSDVNAKKCAFVIKEKDGTYTEKTFADLATDIKGLSNSLLEKNLFGKPVALIGGNSYEWCVSFFATLCAGCAHLRVVLNPHVSSFSKYSDCVFQSRDDTSP